MVCSYHAIILLYKINAKSLGNGSITRESFAYLDRTANYTFVFEPGFNDKEVFPGIIIILYTSRSIGT